MYSFRVEAAAAAGKVRAGADPDDLLRAVASLSTPAHGDRMESVNTNKREDKEKTTRPKPRTDKGETK
jgi:hypothetical protein